jgi:hypothetical protein
MPRVWGRVKTWARHRTHKSQTTSGEAPAASVARFAYTPLPQPDCTRLLVIEPGRGNAPICCRLVTTSTRRNAVLPYIAISYCWESDKLCRRINVEGHKHSITESAFEVLSHLRQPDTSVTIWIDAICINQADTTEKLYQVSRMEIIYSLATKVVVWLGPAFKGVKSFFKTCTDLEHDYQSLQDELGHVEAEQYQKLYRVAASRLRQRDIRTFHELMTRPWWRRLWVFQEVSVAHAVQLRCGRRELNIDAFAPFIRPWDQARGRLGTRDDCRCGNTLCQKHCKPTYGGRQSPTLTCVSRRAYV